MFWKIFLAGLFLGALPAAAQINQSPPKSVWDRDLDGTAIHSLSGVQCPSLVSDFRRDALTMYDSSGFDVSCDFAGPHGVITLYLTRRDPALLQKTFEAAKAAALNRPGAAMRSGLLTAPPGAGWLQAGFTEKNGALDSDLFLKSLAGWEFEYRVSYRTADAGAVTAAIENLTDKVVATAGDHLAACAAAAPSPRTGNVLQADSKLKLALTITGMGWASEDGFERDPDAVWCADAPLSVSGKPAVYWHNIVPGEKGLADKITAVDGSLTILTAENRSDSRIIKGMLRRQGCRKSTTFLFSSPYHLTGGDL